MDKEDAIYIHSGILLSSKEEWNLATCANMLDPEGIMLSEINQIEKINTIWFNVYMDSKSKTDKQKQTHKYREKKGGWQTRLGEGMGKMGEGNWKLQTSTSVKMQA